MREQIRLWFYSQLFMSVALTGRAPFRKVLGYEKMLDEHGKEMHGSWGNMIDAEDAFARMGADVMRWQYCAQPPDRNLLFGFGPAQEIKRRLLTLWNSAKFLADYGAIESFQPVYADLAARRARRPTCSRSTAGSSSGRPSSSRRPRTGTSAGSRSTSRAPSRPTSTISRTGTSGARGGASGTATRRRFARSGSGSSRGCG